MDKTKSSKFEIRGMNHLALHSSDMDRTVRFYQDVLGMPLVKTLTSPNGGQHFFIDISEGNGIAFFWDPERPAAMPGVANGGWDPKHGSKNPTSCVGSMHHLAFDVPLDKLDSYRDRLVSEGIEVTDVTGNVVNADGDDDGSLRSIYFPDPDGFILGFSAWTRPLTPEDVRHEPATISRANTTTREKAATASA
jgi:catechol 2,3-dioxygenase-like lactoylglutathione lyase family enzyme